MPAIITDTFDYNDIVRVLDLDEAFVHHQIDALQPKYWRVVIKTKPKGLKTLLLILMLHKFRFFLPFLRIIVFSLAYLPLSCKMN